MGIGHFCAAFTDNAFYLRFIRPFTGGVHASAAAFGLQGTSAAHSTFVHGSFPHFLSDSPSIIPQGNLRGLLVRLDLSRRKVSDGVTGRERQLSWLEGVRLLLYCYKNTAYSFFTPKGEALNII